MEITRHRKADRLLLVIEGRLDGYWANQLETELEELVRKGDRSIRLDVSQVPFLSSAGIRVFVKYYQNLKKLGGTFGLVNPSGFVAEVLEVSGLETLRIDSEQEEQGEISTDGHPIHLDCPEMEMTLRTVAEGGSLRCRLIGLPERIRRMNYGPHDMHSLSLPPGVFGVGIGAFGRNFADCQTRFGEFLVAGGAAAYLPSEANSAPDFLLSRGEYIPQVQILYALLCDGEPSHLIRFQPKTDAAVCTLSSLVDYGFQATGASTIGMVMMAESAGLVGASLKRSPALDDKDKQPFQFPEVRKWLSYSSERSFRKSLALVTGVATSVERSDLKEVLRPLTGAPLPAGHFHAAAFSYRALHGEEINLEQTVTSLFEGETLQGILHLVADHRDLQGAGESEFIRGALWVGPIERSLSI